MQMSGLAVALLAPLMPVATLTAAHADILTFSGICDASAAVAIDEKTIIVGDDEQPWLSIYDLRNQNLQNKRLFWILSG